MQLAMGRIDVLNPYKELGKKLDTAAMKRACEKWDAVAKPLHGLGKLEDCIVKIAGIQGTENIRLQKRAVLVFCGDNGITAQGVTQTDSSVTAMVADNIAEGRASINKMCSRCNTDVIAVDMGILKETHSEKLRNYKIRRGTRDFTVSPAMTIQETMQAIDTGIALVKELKDKGYALLATGEMGIGNTTTASAVAAALLSLTAEQTVGRGAGLDDTGLGRKRAVVSLAIASYHLYERTPLEVLSCVGGFDIAGMAGAFIGGSIYGVPVIIDGMISAVAALTAYRLCEKALNSMLASHLSREPVSGAVMRELLLEPLLDAGLALGEGTGAALLFPLLDMAENVYQNEETFQKLQLKPYEKFGER